MVFAVCGGAIQLSGFNLGTALFLVYMEMFTETHSNMQRFLSQNLVRELAQSFFPHSNL